MNKSEGFIKLWFEGVKWTELFSLPGLLAAVAYILCLKVIKTSDLQAQQIAILIFSGGAGLFLKNPKAFDWDKGNNTRKIEEVVQMVSALTQQSKNNPSTGSGIFGPTALGYTELAPEELVHIVTSTPTKEPEGPVDGEPEEL